MKRVENINEVFEISGLAPLMRLMAEHQVPVEALVTFRGESKAFNLNFYVVCLN